MRYTGTAKFVRLIAILVVLAFVAAPLTLRAEEKKKFDPKRWEKDIQKFEAQDKENFPKPGGILFVGSSSIRGWNLKKFFPDLKRHQPRIRRLAHGRPHLLRGSNRYSL